MPSYLWLGMEVRRIAGTSGVGVIQVDQQLMAHLDGLVQVIEGKAKTREAASTVIRALGSCLVPLLGTLETLGDVTAGLRDAMEAWRREPASTVDPDAIDTSRSDEAASRLVQLISREAAGIPTVVAVDDAHDLDAAELSFLQHVLASQDCP